MDGNRPCAWKAKNPSELGLPGAQSRSRTGDLRITSALLYLLSYLGGSCDSSNRRKFAKLEWFLRTRFCRQGRLADRWQAQQERLELQHVVWISFHCFQRLVYGHDGSLVRASLTRRACNERISIRRGNGDESGPKLVRTVSTEFALVAILQMLLPGAPFAEGLNACVHLAYLDGVTGREGRGSFVDERHQGRNDSDDNGTGAIDLTGCGGERGASSREARVSG